MRKVLLTLVAVALVGVANAQLFVGGNLNFSKQSGSTETTTTVGSTTTTVNTDNPSSVNWNILPKIGYQINDKLSAGLIIGIGSSKYTYYPTNPLYNNYEVVTKDMTLQAVPFVRYNALQLGNFSLFAELQIPISNTTGTETSTYDVVATNAHVEEDVDNPKTFSFGIQIVPGLSYNFNEKISADLYVDLLSLYYINSKTTTTTEGEGYSNEEVSTTNKFGLGVQTLPQTITLGFNYKF